MVSDESTHETLPWLRGAVISGLGVVVGSVALALFCYSLGLNFTDEGWADDHDVWESHSITLICSLIGMGVAILLFWAGFFQTTQGKRN